MRQIIMDNMQGDLVVSTQDLNLQKAVSDAAKQGALIHLVSNIYIRAEVCRDRAEACRQRLWEILGLLFPGALVSHRTAMEFAPFENAVVLTYRYRKTYHAIPGLTVHLLKGSPPIDGLDQPFTGGLFVSCPARAWLENIGENNRRGFPFRLGQKQIEEKIESLIQKRGLEAAKAIHQTAQLNAPQIGLTDEIEKLNGIFSALIVEDKSKASLKSAALQARQGQKPYDGEALIRLTKLHDYLATQDIPSVTFAKGLGRTALSNLAFADAYFSNYIEGTKFAVPEAEKIVFQNQIPPKRPEGHDIAGTYSVLFRHLLRGEHPSLEFDSFVDHIHAIHAEIMVAHDALRPGQFKDRQNYAGITAFVAPELVIGTLAQGLILAHTLSNGLPRAIYLKFMLTEVHPYIDGNGRLSRIIMNQELFAAGETPIIIPTVYRPDYIGGIKALSKSNNVRTFVRMLQRAQAFTAKLPCEDYDGMIQFLKEKQAFSEDPNDILRF